MRWSDPREAVDVGIGFVGFFAVAFFVITLVCELTGQPALVWALITLALVVLLIALWQARHRILAARLRAQQEQAASEQP